MQTSLGRACPTGFGRPFAPAFGARNSTKRQQQQQQQQHNKPTTAAAAARRLGR
jgi:hypothetical protein